MNELAGRKRLIVARADLHRQILAAELQRLEGRWDAARGFVVQYRWCLLGAAAVGGLLLGRKRRGLSGWLPAMVAVWRALRR
ncbi:MAG: hypothetical protein PHQ04_08700 [Opitutaceae bacterium]|nr:hypothetical protein [Opitutaceae bacterium]